VRIHRIALASALLFGTGGAFAADGDLPSAETILDRNVEANGGRAAYEKRHSTCRVEDFEVVNTPIKGTMTTYGQAPDKKYSEIDIPMVGKFRQGSDGRIAWSLSEMAGPKLLEGEERAIALISGRFNNELYWRELYKRVETVGMEDVDGKPAYIVVRTPKEGKPVTEYFDAATFLTVKGVMKLQTADGEIRAEVFPSDYRKEGGIMVPHKVVTKSAGQERVITLRTFTVNEEAPAGTFDIPAEIRALLKQP